MEVNIPHTMAVIATPMIAIVMTSSTSVTPASPPSWPGVDVLGAPRRPLRRSNRHLRLSPDLQVRGDDGEHGHPCVARTQRDQVTGPSIERAVDRTDVRLTAQVHTVCAGSILEEHHPVVQAGARGDQGQVRLPGHPDIYARRRAR